MNSNQFVFKIGKEKSPVLFKGKNQEFFYFTYSHPHHKCRKLITY